MSKVVKKNCKFNEMIEETTKILSNASQEERKLGENSFWNSLTTIPNITTITSTTLSSFKNYFYAED